MIALAPRVLPESREPDPRPFDVASAALSALALLAGILAGVAVAVMFVCRQYVTDHPLIDLRLFRAPAPGVAVAAMVLATFVMAARDLRHGRRSARDRTPGVRRAWGLGPVDLRSC